MNFKCQKCGRCCGNYLPLMSSEIKQLKRIVKTRKLKPIKHAIINDSQMVCPFLDNNFRCTIYDDRPLICRTYTCHKLETMNFEGMEPLLNNCKLTDIRKDIFNAK